jgi:GT2 family glycosyltransferase
MTSDKTARSIVIPVLDFSLHSPYNIRTLLDDLSDFPGEVICVFNGEDVYREMHSHKRIDKYCHNNLNAGVSRSWNIGMAMAEGAAVFVLNADVRVRPAAFQALETWLFSLDKAVIVGPQGSHIDFRNLTVLRYFEKGTFAQPVRTHDVSGFFFCIHMERFRSHRLMFDAQFSPCFFEEWDMGLQVMQAGLACYAVPVGDFEHRWGMSQYSGDPSINYFGRELKRSEILMENRRRFLAKWQHLLRNEPR